MSGSMSVRRSDPTHDFGLGRHTASTHDVVVDDHGGRGHNAERHHFFQVRDLFNRGGTSRILHGGIDDVFRFFALGATGTENFRST